MHIGLIGGIGPAATVFYYQQIVAGFANEPAELQLTIGHTSALTLSRNVAAGRIDEQVREYRRIAEQLAAAGANVIAITSMGGHFCAAQFAAVSPLPIIDGPTAVADYLKQEDLRRVGILGTKIVMQTSLFGALGDLDPVSLPDSRLKEINDDYVAVAIAGKADSAQRGRLVAAGQELVDMLAAEAILLGGTDLNLVYENVQFGVPIIDSAQIHANAIVRAAKS